MQGDKDKEEATMKAVHGSRRGFISGLVVSGLVALAALQAPAAYAAPVAHISASVADLTTIHVAGYGFGPGDRVEVVDSAGGRVFTYASRIILPPPPPLCRPNQPCRPPVLLPGLISVTLPRIKTCALERVSIHATDLTDHTHSNLVHVIVGEGICPA
jgi:hypothetical protein